MVRKGPRHSWAGRFATRGGSLNKEDQPWANKCVQTRCLSPREMLLSQLGQVQEHGKVEFGFQLSVSAALHGLWSDSSECRLLRGTRIRHYRYT